MLWEKLDHGNDLLTMEEDFPSILMYWASVIVTARIGKPSVARFGGHVIGSIGHLCWLLSTSVRKVDGFALVFLICLAALVLHR